MLHTKYQGSKPSGFRQDDFYVSIIAYVKHVTPGAGHCWPTGLNLVAFSTKYAYSVFLDDGTQCSVILTVLFYYHLITLFLCPFLRSSRDVPVAEQYGIGSVYTFSKNCNMRKLKDGKQLL